MQDIKKFIFNLDKTVMPQDANVTPEQGVKDNALQFGFADAGEFSRAFSSVDQVWNANLKSEKTSKFKESFIYERHSKPFS